MIDHWRGSPFTHASAHSILADIGGTPEHMSDTDWSRLQRPRQPMADDITERLEKNGLVHAYRERPAYQQNDYLSWIERAKRPETREKRLAQMLEELERGGVYMKMEWRGRAPR